MNKHIEFIDDYERRQAIEIESLRKKIKELTEQVADLKESNRAIRGTSIRPCCCHSLG
mgnify:CR=1 FL=1|tara:strand:- start:1108 stop:1281 length:174 start_codon:yes stop_codon:yes gene_type:complete